MIKKLNWKIGNSTLRNPSRIFKAFPLFVELFEEKRFKPVQFINKLNQTGDFNFKSKSKKIHGGIIRSVFRELGFIKKNEDIEKVTEVGREYLKKPDNFNLIYLKQLAKYQFNNGTLTCKPLLIFIKILRDLKQFGVNFITKEEFQLFVMTCMNVNDSKIQAKKIISFRQEEFKLSSLEKKQKRKEFIYKKILEVYEADYLSRVNLLREILLNQPIEDIQNNPSLLDKVVSSSRGSKSKKAMILKQEIIDCFQESNIDDCILLFTNSYCEAKRKSLQSDANMTLQYIMQTGIFELNKSNISIMQKYDVIAKYIVNKYHNLLPNKHSYLRNYYFNQEQLLVNKVVSVEIADSFKEIAKSFNHGSYTAILTLLFYLGFRDTNPKIL